MSEDTITLAGRLERMCRAQQELTELADRIGLAIVEDDWIAVEGLADRVQELGIDLGLDAYLTSKALAAVSP